MPRPPTRRAILRATALGGGFLLWPGAALAQSGTLRADLESVYVRWLQAMTHRDPARWAAVTSRYRQMSLRNQVVSLKQPWPRAVFQGFLQPPDVTRLQFIDASSKGDTARLVFFGRVDFQLVPGEITPENPLVLHFLKEGGEWKFNTIQYVNLNLDPDLKREAAAGGKKWLGGEDFRLSGTYPEVPKACPEPYQVANVSVEADGCRVTVDINNGIHQETVENTNADHIVIGGLRKGANKLVITPVLKTGGRSAKPHLRVTVSARTGVPSRPLVHLLDWKPPEEKWNESYALSVWVRSIASLNGP